MLLEIHKEYEEEIEKQILQALPKDFNMVDFMGSLPAYIEGEGRNDDATGKAITLLLEVSDFQQFKMMMLFARREKEEGESKHAGFQLEGISTKGSDVMIADVEGMMDMAIDLAQVADDNGWTNCLTLDWMKIDKRPVELSKRKSANDVYLRGVWTMNLSFVECCDMMFSLTARRKNWDPNFGGVSFPNGGSDASDDVVTSVIMDFGYLVNLIMFGSKGMNMTMRNIRRSVTTI